MLVILLVKEQANLRRNRKLRIRITITKSQLSDKTTSMRLITAKLLVVVQKSMLDLWNVPIAKESSLRIGSKNMNLYA